MVKQTKKTTQIIKKVLKEMKNGKLKGGFYGKKVTSHKQAIAIGFDRAKKQGETIRKKSSF